MPRRTLSKFSKFVAEFPEVLITFLYFLTENTCNKIMLTNFQKLLSNNIFFFKKAKLRFFKKVGKTKIINCVFGVLVPENMKILNTFEAFPIKK